MDDHLYEYVMDYGNCLLIQYFNEEYKKYGKMSLCPSYEEVKDFCKVLNLILKWDFTRNRNIEWYKVSPRDFLDIE